MDRIAATELPERDPGRIISRAGIVVDLGEFRSRRLRIALDADDCFEIILKSRMDLLGTEIVTPVPFPETPGLIEYTFDLPPESTHNHLTQIVVVPLSGDGAYAIGRVEGLP